MKPRQRENNSSLYPKLHRERFGELAAFIALLMFFGLWFCWPSQVKPSDNRPTRVLEPSAAYVEAKIAAIGSKSLLPRIVGDSHQDCPVFSLLRLPDRPSVPPPPPFDIPVASLSVLHECKFTPTPYGILTLSDVPSSPLHPFASLFNRPVEFCVAPVISKSLTDAGFSFSPPEDSKPGLRFKVFLEFEASGHPVLALFFTEYDAQAILPWRQAIMLSTVTNRASGTVSLE